MKRQVHSRINIFFLLVITFSFCVFGCGEKEEKKMQTEKVEGTTSRPEVSQAFPIDDDIQLDEWMQLAKEINSTLSEMEEMGKKVLQTSD